MPSLRRRINRIRRNFTIDNQIRRLPNVFTGLIGESEGGMKWKSYLSLNGSRCYETRGWRCVSDKVCKALAGRKIISNPFLQFNESPLEPGLLIINRFRSFIEYLTRGKKDTIATELIWDFYPKWATEEEGFKPMKSKTIESDPDFEFSHTCSFRPYRDSLEERAVSVKVQGKSVVELDNMSDLNNRVINFDGFEESSLDFNDLWINIVERVYYVDRLELTVAINGVNKFIKIEESRFPVGFTSKKLYIGLDTYEARFIQYITKKSYSAMNSRWLPRTQMWPYLRRAIVNSEKYGNSSGDSSGRTNHAPQTQPIRQHFPDHELG